MGVSLRYDSYLMLAFYFLSRLWPSFKANDFDAQHLLLIKSETSRFFRLCRKTRIFGDRIINNFQPSSYVQVIDLYLRLGVRACAYEPSLDLADQLADQLVSWPAWLQRSVRARESEMKRSKYIGREAVWWIETLLR